MTGMNPEQQLIQSAWQDTVKGLYAKLFDAYVTAGGNPAQTQAADQRFMTGIGFARSSRDRAIALLAPAAAGAGA